MEVSCLPPRLLTVPLRRLFPIARLLVSKTGLPSGWPDDEVGMNRNPEDTPRVVAVTGASGYVGTHLLRILENDDGLGKIVAIDTRPPAVPVHNMAAYRRDVADTIEDVLSRHRVSTLVHLAFNARRGRNRRETEEIRQANLNILNQVLDDCLKSRVDHVIYLSSHTVYGARADNPIPLTVNAPLRPSPGFSYGYDKYLAEQRLGDFARHHEDVAVTVLRSCGVLGPAGGDHLALGMFRRLLLGVSNSNLPMQFVYEDDLARVMTIFIKRRLPGLFNVAGDGVVFCSEIAEIMEGKVIRLPSFLAYPMARLAWNLGSRRDASAAGLDFLRHPIVMSTAGLHHETGYRFRHTSLDAVTSFIRYRAVEEEAI